MQQRTVVILSVSIAAVLALGATAAIAGPAFYRDVIVGEQPAAPTIAPPSASAAPTPGVVREGLDGAWTVADGSFAGYRVDEVLNGTDVTVVGRTESVSGALEVDGLTLTAATIEVDVASIATDSGSRDDYFRQNALRTAQFPTATFVLTEPVTAPAAPAAGDEATLTALGELTIAGVTRPVSVELDAAFDGDGGQVVGSIPIVFADFGVEAPSLGFVSVEPEGFVEFSLVIRPA